jgi:hypothetical protein
MSMAKTPKTTAAVVRPWQPPEVKQVEAVGPILVVTTSAGMLQFSGPSLDAMDQAVRQAIANRHAS